MSDGDRAKTATTEADGSGKSGELSAKALEELEERLVKKILDRVSPRDDPGEGTSKGMQELEERLVKKILDRVSPRDDPGEGTSKGTDGKGK